MMQQYRLQVASVLDRAISRVSEFSDTLELDNPYHDERGRFASGPSAAYRASLKKHLAQTEYAAPLITQPGHGDNTNPEAQGKQGIFKEIPRNFPAAQKTSEGKTIFHVKVGDKTIDTAFKHDFYGIPEFQQNLIRQRESGEVAALQNLVKDLPPKMLAKSDISEFRIYDTSEQAAYDLNAPSKITGAYNTKQHLLSLVDPARVNAGYATGVHSLPFEGVVYHEFSHSVDTFVPSERLAKEADEVFPEDAPHSALAMVMPEKMPLSMGPKWHLAWSEEIFKPDAPLSRYATTSPVEGWAEFGRLVIQQPGEAKAKFPKSWQTWK